MIAVPGTWTECYYAGMRARRGGMLCPVNPYLEVVVGKGVDAWNAEEAWNRGWKDADDLLHGKPLRHQWGTLARSAR